MNNSDRVKEIQKNFTGDKYVGASLSSMGTSDRIRKELFEWLKNKTKFLVLHGPCGTGKTYIATALIEYLIPMTNFIRGYRESMLFDKVRKMFSEGQSSFNEYLQYQIDDHIVLIDDLGQCARTDFREDLILEILEYRKSIPGITIFTTNHNKISFKERFGERAASRLFAAENKIIDFHGLVDLREKRK